MFTFLTCRRICPKRISIAAHVFLGRHIVLDGTNGLEIHEGAQIRDRVQILTHEQHRPALPTNAPRNIMIDTCAVIGTGSIILPGVLIGENASILPGSVVLDNVPPYAIACGNPALIIGDVRKVSYV